MKARIKYMSTPKELSLVPSVSTNSQLQITQDGQISLTEMERLASHFTKSGLFGLGEPAQSTCVVKMLAGKELGIAPFTAIKEIYVIQGRLTLSAHLMAVLIKKHPDYNYKIVKHTDEVCSIDFYERDKETRKLELVGNSEFTIDHAKKAGLLTDTKLYNKYTRNMLYSRAMSNGAKWYCPLVFGGGVYTPDELQQEENEPRNITPLDFITQLERLDNITSDLSSNPDSHLEFPDYRNLSLAELKNQVDSKSKMLTELLIDKLLLKGVEPTAISKLSLVQLYTKYKELNPEQPLQPF